MKDKKKLVCSLIVLLVICSLMLPLPTAVAEASPATEIRDWYDLHAVRDNLSGGYLLMNDLDATVAGYEELAGEAAHEGQGWQPIGIYSQDSFDPFIGTFDGQGYEIRDFFIDRPDVVGVGLFGVVAGVGDGGVIEDVGVVNARVSGDVGVGGLVGLSAGNVSNSYCIANVTGGSRVGGLVGFNAGSGTVDDCHSSGNVTGHDILVGGVIGYNMGMVSNSYSGAGVTGDGGVGGLVGGNEGTVRNSYASGDVTGEWWNIGGVVGHNWDGIVANCYASGNVSGGSRVGGLVGYNDLYATVARSYANGSVNGDDLVGGLVGYNRDTISGCYALGSVTGNSSVGGLVGGNDDIVENSFWDREASGVETSDGGAGKTAAAMRDIATFLAVAWDITAVAHGETDDGYFWNIVDGETYAFLSAKQFITYDLTISSTAGGSVTVPGEGVYTYLAGEVVDLAVEAEELHRFGNWTGEVDTIARVTSGQTTITMDGNYSITANFEEIQPAANWPLIGLIIGVVVVVGLFVYAPLRRKIKQVRRSR
ncbi:MAG: GLUG motif-containing protein [Dehalococcoidia bacterium]